MCLRIAILHQVNLCRCTTYPYRVAYAFLLPHYNFQIPQPLKLCNGCIAKKKNQRETTNTKDYNATDFFATSQSDKKKPSNHAYLGYSFSSFPFVFTSCVQIAKHNQLLSLCGIEISTFLRRNRMFSWHSQFLVVKSEIYGHFMIGYAKCHWQCFNRMPFCVLLHAPHMPIANRCRVRESPAILKHENLQEPFAHTLTLTQCLSVCMCGRMNAQTPMVYECQ